MSSNLIAKACSDEYDQPQGFVLNQLAKTTVGDVRECEAIVSELMKKLERSSPDIKFKALRTLKYLCINGRAEVRLMLQSEYVNEIKKCLQFRGPPDPLRGDAPSQRVRDEAKDTLHTLYNYSQHQHAAPVGRIEGYGVSEPSATSPSPSDSYSFNPVIPPSPYANNAQTYQGTYSTPQLHDAATSKYTGYGSDGAHQPSQPHLIDKLKAKASNNNGAPLRPYQYPSAYSTNDFGANASSTNDSSATVRARGQVGGMWASAPTSSTLTNSNSNTRPTFGDSSSSTTASASSSLASQPIGEYETRLVESVCASSGVRSQPTKEELTKFESQAVSLNKLQLVSLLNDKIASNQPWMTQMKALCYLELLLSSPLLVATCDQLCDFLCDNATNLQQLEQSPQVLVRNKCVRVQELAGLREEQAAPTNTATTAASSNNFVSQAQKPQQQQTLDLLNFVQPTPASSSASSSSVGAASSSLNLLDSLQTNNNSADDASNLFGNLKITQQDHVTNNGANNANNHNNSAADSFSFIHTPTPSTVKPTIASFSSSSGLDPFAGLTSKTSASSSSSTSTVPSSSSSSSSSSSDPFASLTGLGGSSLTNSNSGVGGGVKKIDPVTFLLATSKPSTPANLINAPYAPHHHHHHHHYHHHHHHHHHHPYHQLQHPHNSQSQLYYPSAPAVASSQSLNFTVRPASNDGRQRGNIDDLSLMPSISSSTGSASTSSTASGAFGFVNETKRDEFGFVTDMMKS